MANRISTAVISIVIVVTVQLAQSALAQDEPAWVVELEPMYLWLIDGEDSYNPGREIEQVWDGTSFGPYRTVRDFDAEFDDEQFTFRGEIQRRRNDEWGYGAMGWWFDTDTSRVTANPMGTASGIPFFDSPGDTFGGLDVPSLRGVSTPIGDNGFFIDNVFNELSFSAEAEFDLFKVDIHGMRELGEPHPNRTWDFLFGIELVKLEMERRETIRNVSPRVADPAVSDDITIIEHNGDLDYGLAFGPMFGLQYERRMDQHRFKGLVTQSFVFADEDSDGRIIQTTQEVMTNGSIMTVGRTQLGSSSGDDSEMLPITEVKLAYNYDVTTNASIGVGGFLSVWWDAPASPTFRNDNSETLVFLGAFFSGQIRFD